MVMPAEVMRTLSYRRRPVLRTTRAHVYWYFSKLPVSELLALWLVTKNITLLKSSFNGTGSCTYQEVSQPNRLLLRRSSCRNLREVLLYESRYVDR